jgi:DNA-3-methyladenine glycosylase
MADGRTHYEGFGARGQGRLALDGARVLSRQFFDRNPVTVARELLGKWLLHDDHGELLIGRIVETEAYLAVEDPASHSYRGQTLRNTAMFGPPGHAYIYAMHRYHCLNVVTEGEGTPSAVCGCSVH